LFDFTRQAGFIVTIQHDEDGLRLVATTPCSIPAEAFAEARHIVDNRVETEKITLGRPAQKICNRTSYRSCHHRQPSCMMLSFVIYFFVFIVPKLPEIRDWAEQGLAKEIAAENAYYCEKIGMKANTQKYEQRLLDLGDFRLKVENGISDEYDF
jgi:hypothetical protein